MTEEAKKNVFGAYNKKSFEEIIESLTNELAVTKSEMIQLNQHSEKMLCEYKVRLTNLEAEIDVKTNIINQLRRQVEEQDREIQILNHNMEDRTKYNTPYNANFNRIGEVYAMAFDAAQKMAEEAQNSAEDFVGVVYEKIIDTQNELSKIKSTSIDIKTGISQQLDRIKNQVMLLQDKLSHIADEESDLEKTIITLNDLKDKAIDSIGQEIHQYALKNKTFSPTQENFTPIQQQPEFNHQRPAEYSPEVFGYSQRPAEKPPEANDFIRIPTEPVKSPNNCAQSSAEPTVPTGYAPILNPSVSASDSMQDQNRYFKENETPQNNSVDRHSDDYYTSLAMAQKADEERYRASANIQPMPPAQSFSPESGQQQNNVNIPSVKPTEVKPEYSNSKSASVKDILKKYSST